MLDDPQIENRTLLSIIKSDFVIHIYAILYDSQLKIRLLFWLNKNKTSLSIIILDFYDPQGLLG